MFCGGMDKQKWLYKYVLSDCLKLFSSTLPGLFFYEVGDCNYAVIVEPEATTAGLSHAPSLHNNLHITNVSLP